MKSRRPTAAFTLIELIMVIAIIAVVASLALPVLRGFRKGDAMLAATRQMLDAVARARQLAISHHTTVYMVFAPPTLYADSFFNNVNLTPAQRLAATNVLDDQMSGYAFVTLRTVGDQPGRPTPRYLSAWQSLPESAFIPGWKFALGPATPFQFTPDQVGNPTVFYVVYGFDRANVQFGPVIPFPSADVAYNSPPVAQYAVLPYIAFDYLGRLVSGLPGHDELIPLAHGGVLPARDPRTKALVTTGPPLVQESPEGNSTNISFNLIRIDRLTGRARLERAQTR